MKLSRLFEAIILAPDWGRPYKIIGGRHCILKSAVYKRRIILLAFIKNNL